MRITILQTNIIWANPQANIQEAERLMEATRGSELYVLPEMWTTGFATQPGNIADSEGLALDWMMSAAEQYGAAVCGSVAVREGEVYANRHYFVRPDRTYDYYDKHHLFTYGHEDKHYTAGNRRTVAQYRGVRFLLVTCYDLRFPLWLRYREDYDAIIIVANWPDSRQGAWQTLTRARAIENQCCVIACNRTGNDPYSQYAGESCVIDAYGNTLIQARSYCQEAVTAEIDMAEQARFRDKFPVLRERDSFCIK